MYKYPESNERAAPIPSRAIPTTASIPTTTPTHTPATAMSNSTTISSPTPLASSSTGRSYDAYPIHSTPHEVPPGIMSDGTLSASHPLVQQFLAYTTRKFLATEVRAAAAGARTAKTKAKWHGAHKHPLVTRWRCMHGGGARVADVHAALGPGVTDRLAGAVFALAALSVYAFWARPVHWAFWAVNIVEETAAVVHEVVRADPKVIHVPDEVAWVDVEMAVNVLRVWHGGFVPYQKPKKPKQAADDAAKEDSEGETKNTNGKRAAPSDGPPPPPPPKKKRSKEKMSVLPTRQSTRIRKGAQAEQAPDPTPDVTSTPSPPTTKPIVDEPEYMVIDVECVEPTAVVEEESEPQAQELPVAQSAKKSRSRPARVTKTTGGGTNRKGARKPRASCGDAPSEQPQPLPARPSSTPSPGRIRIPARPTPQSASPCPASRELLDAVSALQTVSAPPALASGETTTAASRESTAVGTPFSGLSTRVGTPVPEFKVKVEPVVVKPKVVREIPAPVRTSARIRAKSLRGAPQRW